MEIWDAYDKDFNKIKDVTLIRGNAILDGMYHLVSEIIVRHVDGTYLLMQRDYKKKFGGMWELTSGGSALMGETSLECAKRELKEETGIGSDNFREIKRIIHDVHHTLYVLYLCITNCDKNSIELQDGETIAYKWVERDVLLNLSDDELVSQRAIQCVEEFNI